MEDKVETKDDKTTKTTINDVGRGLVLLGVIVLVVYLFMLPFSLMISVTNEQVMYNMWRETTLLLAIGFSLALIITGFALSFIKKSKGEEQI